MTDVKPRIPLSKQRVLQAARDLADAEGLDALTMRRLGQRLGVEAMSLYNHVANKDQVLDGIVELVAAEIEPPPAGSPWRAALRRHAIAAHDALLRHPWAGSLWVRPTLGPTRMRHIDATLRTLREAGFAPSLLDRAFHTLENHVLGHALQRIGFHLDDDEMARGAARFLRQLDDTAYPDIAAHVRWHVQHPGGDDEFVFGLDLILDGLERARDTAG